MAVRPIDASRFGEILEQWKKDCLQDNDTQGADIISDVILQLDDMPTLTPPNEWVSVEERLPEDEARQYIEDVLDGIGYLYPCLLTYKSPNTERIHVVRFYYDIIQKWFVNNGEELCEKGRCIAWMPLPAPPDKDNHVPAKAPNEPLTIEQLREMKDEPAYLKVFDPLLKSGWHIIKAVTKDKIIFRGWQTVYVPIDGMGVNYNLYRCPPEGEEET